MAARQLFKLRCVALTVVAAFSLAGCGENAQQQGSSGSSVSVLGTTVTLDTTLSDVSAAVVDDERLMGNAFLLLVTGILQRDYPQLRQALCLDIFPDTYVEKVIEVASSVPDTELLSARSVTLLTQAEDQATFSLQAELSGEVGYAEITVVPTGFGCVNHIESSGSLEDLLPASG